MKHHAMVTLARRDELRRLKTEFDTACAAVDDFSNRDDPSFRAAQDLYRTWIKAIDAAALALLDDLDAFDQSGSDSAQSPSNAAGVYSPVERVRPGDVDHIFAEIDDALHVQAIVTQADEDDTTDLFGS